MHNVIFEKKVGEKIIISPFFKPLLHAYVQDIPHIIFSLGHGNIQRYQNYFQFCSSVCILGKTLRRRLLSQFSLGYHEHSKYTVPRHVTWDSINVPRQVA